MTKFLWFLLRLNVVIWLAAAATITFMRLGEANGGPEKITICHFGETKEIPAKAIEPHLEHGDYLGVCVPEFGPESSDVVRVGIIPMSQHPRSPRP